MKRSLCIMLVFLMALCMIPTVAFAAETTKSDDGIWTIAADYSSNTCTVTRWHGNTAEVNFPSKIPVTSSVTGETRTLKVTALDLHGRSGFGYEDSDQVKSIIVPSSVTTIGSGCFEELKNLENVSLPNSITTMGDYVFEDCVSLEEMTMPDKIKEVPYRTFWGCTSLTKVNFAKGTTKIGSFAFNGCSSLTSISLPSTLKEIGRTAFSKTGLTKISIPKSVTSDLYEAFYECKSLKSVTLPTKATYLGNFAFGRCSVLEQITIPSNYTKMDTHAAFQYCPRLSSIYIQNPNPEAVYGFPSSVNLTVYSASSATKVREACKKAGVAWKYVNPVKLSAKRNSPTKASLSWKKVTTKGENGAAITGFQIYRKVKGGSYKRVKTVSKSTSKYTDKSLKKGKTYYYVVKTVTKDAMGKTMVSTNSNTKKV